MNVKTIVAWLRADDEPCWSLDRMHQAADLIEQLQREQDSALSKLSSLEIERSMDQKLIDAEQGRIKILVDRLSAALDTLNVLALMQDSAGHVPTSIAERVRKLGVVERERERRDPIDWSHTTAGPPRGVVGPANATYDCERCGRVPLPHSCGVSP